MNYRGVADLNRAIAESLHLLPNDIDLVVGIPRSGMLPATLLAMYLHLPLTDIDGLIEGRLLQGGPRLGRRSDASNVFSGSRVLVVDDSAASGAAMNEARKKIESANLAIRPIYAAVFAAPGLESVIDISFDLVPLPRVFEWNIMNCWCTGQSCVDIDGVLCRNPTDAENDDGERYLHFVRTAPPLMRPRGEIGFVVTSRLEKYRTETEGWLFRNQIKYKKLFMMAHRSAEERRRENKYSDFKAQVYLRTDATLFIESDYDLAMEISKRTLKPVYCVDRGCMIRTDDAETFTSSDIEAAAKLKLVHFARRAKRKIARSFRSSVIRLLRRVP